MKEDIKELKSQVEEVKKQGFAFEILKDYKKQNKRQFIVTIIVLIMWFLTIGYLVYVLNDIGSTSETITQEVESNENSTINQNVGV